MNMKVRFMAGWIGAYHVFDESAHEFGFGYSFKATVSDGTGNAEFTFFTEAGEKLTGDSCTDVGPFRNNRQTQMPIQLVKTIEIKTCFPIQFSSNTQKGADRFIVNDILDISSTKKQETTAIISRASVNKGKEPVIIEKEPRVEVAVQTNLETTRVPEKGYNRPGPPTEDAMEQVAETIIQPIPRRPLDEKATPATARKSLAKEPSTQQRKRRRLTT